MSWLKDKFWPWLKKWWKWILFPVGLVSLIILGTKKSEVAPDAERLEEADEKKEEAIVKAESEKDARLQALAEYHADKLKNITKEQKKELEALAGKPIDEVVKWFDKL